MQLTGHYDLIYHGLLNSQLEINTYMFRTNTVFFFVKKHILKICWCVGSLKKLELCHSQHEEHSDGDLLSTEVPGYKEAIINLTSNFYSFCRIIRSKT